MSARVLSVIGLLALPVWILGEEETTKERVDTELGRVFEGEGKPWRLTLRFGGGWDSNPGLLSTHENIRSGKLEDERFYSEIRFSVDVFKNETSSLEVAYQFYRESYNHFDEYALDAHTFPLRYRRDYVKWGYELSLYHSYISLGRRGVLREYLFSPSVYWSQTEKLSALFSGSFYYRDYLHDGDYTGAEFSVGYTQQIMLDENVVLRLFAELGYVGARNNDYRYRRCYLGASLDLPVLPDIAGTIRVGNEIRDYTHRDATFGEKRDEARWHASIALTKRLSERLTIALKYDYINKGSDVDEFRYRRKLLGLEVLLEF